MEKRTMRPDPDVRGERLFGTGQQRPHGREKNIDLYRAQVSAAELYPDEDTTLLQVKVWTPPLSNWTMLALDWVSHDLIAITQPEHREGDAWDTLQRMLRAKGFGDWRSGAIWKKD